MSWDADVGVNVRLDDHAVKVLLSVGSSISAERATSVAPSIVSDMIRTRPPDTFP